MFAGFNQVFLRKPIFSYHQLFDENNNYKEVEKITQEFLENPLFLESIFWSSPSFYQLLKQFKKGEINDEKKRLKIITTLQKYIIRSCTRTTPFGTFAGVTSLPAIGIDKPQRKVRIDTAILHQIKDAIMTEAAFLPYINFQINNTLYAVEEEVRFIEVAGDQAQHVQISSIEKNDILKIIIRHFKHQTFTFQEVKNLFKEEFEEEDLYDFYIELIDAQFLVGELEITLTQKEEFYKLKKFLKSSFVADTFVAQNWLSIIHHIEYYIHQLESLPLGDFAENDFEKIKNQLASNHIITDNGHLFQVDLLLPPEQEDLLAPSLQKNIIQTLKIMGLLSKSEVTPNPYLEDFKTLFLERYENSFVPLLEILDPDVGIGFPAHKNMGHHTGHFNKLELPSKDSLSDWLWDKIEAQNSAKEIIITEDDIRFLEKNREQSVEEISSVGYVMFRPITEKQCVIENVAEGSPNALLSRFSYMSQEIEEICKEVSSYEETCFEESLIADIIWSPSSKIANIIRHQSNMKWEIPIYYSSSKEKENQILLQDILVSVVRNKIVLYSKQLKKRIIPRLNNAHNFYESTNSLYQFLCCLQYQDKRSYSLTPDFKNNRKRCFPRIQYKDMILSPAHWILRASDLQKINSSHGEAALENFFKQWDVPQRVVLVQGDHEILIDIQNKTSIQLLLTELRKLKNAILKEWLYTPSENKDNRIRQYILPLKKAGKTESLSCKPASKDPQVSKNFLPGEQWAYFKIYCSSSFSDKLLLNIEKEVIKKLIKKGKISQFFFIRYLDPHYHLRLRFKMQSPEVLADITELMNKTLKKWMGKGMVWEVSQHSYQRELDRYGIKTIDFAEELFYQDSQLFLNHLKMGFLEDATSRFYLALKKVDQYFSWANMEVLERKNFCTQMMNFFAQEMTPNVKKDVEDRYRNEKEAIHRLLSNNKKDNQPLFKENASEIIHQNLSDYIHMSINRWFADNQRQWEYTLYYFGEKYYARCYYNT